MKDVVFWDVASCSSCVNRRFGGTYCFHIQGRKIRERGTSVSRWLQTELPVENWLTRVIFYPEYEGDMFLRNVGSYKNYTAPRPRNGILHLNEC
jgi:hypothetical protein